MKSRVRLLLPVFLLAAAAGLGARLLMRPATAGAPVPSARLAPPPVVEEPPADTGEVIARLRDAEGKSAKLLASDTLVRKLTITEYPGACDEGLALADAERKPILRLLLIRWAELDGLAALTWAKEHLWKKDSEEWRVWLADLASTWFAAQPRAAAEWMAEITEGENREAWAPLGGHIAVNDWIPPGAVVEMAKAVLSRQKKGTFSIGLADDAGNLASLIRTRVEIDALQELLAKYPVQRAKRIKMNGTFGTSSDGGKAATPYAAAVEKAWPRVDPAGFREYAKEHVTGITGDHLPLLAALEDCRASAEPSKVAVQFLTAWPPEDLRASELLTLAEAVAEKDPRNALESLRGSSAPSAALAIEQFVRTKTSGDWRAVIAALEDCMAPAARQSAVEASLVRWHAIAPEEVDNFLKASRWDEARLKSFTEMLASAP